MSSPLFHHVHFIGIGGIGMSGIAQILAAQGVSVSGSDLRESPITRRLVAEGIRVHIGHRAEHVAGADLVVYSSAVRPDNPEMAAARQAGIPIWMRARMLGEILNPLRAIVIAGTHGKTTTTSMECATLERAGLSPTCIIGGELDLIGGNAKLGTGEYAVAEGDESDGSFTWLRPYVALVNNIDADHLDHFADIDAVARAFSEFLDGVHPCGRIYLSADCMRARQLGVGRSQDVFYYGLHPLADYTARHIRTSPQDTSFVVVDHGREVGELRLSIPGLHTVHNSLGACAIALGLGVAFPIIAQTLADLSGPRRRFELIGRQAGVSVIDDYAHHPAEIRATLAGFAQRYPGRRIGVFQPHRYTRTAALLQEFGDALTGLDALILTDIYSAGESPIPGIDGHTLFHAVSPFVARAEYAASLDDAAARVLDLVQPGDAVITMGAGDVWKVGREVLRRLGERS